MALAARAFGAQGIWIDSRDPAIEEGIRDVVSRFGGDFSVKTGVRWREAIAGWKGSVVHLTMYGEPLDEFLSRELQDDVLVVVGAEKVPGELFEMVDFNVAVGNQPHSEVAALAVFLDRFLRGAGIRREFKGSLRVVPSPRGKRVEGGSTAGPQA